MLYKKQKANNKTLLKLLRQVKVIQLNVQGINRQQENPIYINTRYDIWILHNYNGEMKRQHFYKEIYFRSFRNVVKLYIN